MTSRLGQKLAGGAAAPAEPAKAESRLKRQLAGGRRGEVVTLPVVGKVWVELVGTLRWNEIEAEVRREMRRLEVDPESLGGAAMFEVQMSVRMLAAGTFEPEDKTTPIGTVEEWGAMDPDIVNVAFMAMGDVRERLDPVGMSPSEDEMFAIAAAVKKKDGRFLRTFGTARLAAYLLATADPPSTSPPPSSPSTDSPSS